MPLIATPRTYGPGARRVALLVRDIDFTEDGYQGTPNWREYPYWLGLFMDARLKCTMSGKELNVPCTLMELLPWLVSRWAVQLSLEI